MIFCLTKTAAAIVSFALCDNLRIVSAAFGESQLIVGPKRSGCYKIRQLRIIEDL